MRSFLLVMRAACVVMFVVAMALAVFAFTDGAIGPAIALLISSGAFAANGVAMHYNLKTEDIQSRLRAAREES